MARGGANDDGGREQGGPTGPCGAKVWVQCGERWYAGEVIEVVSSEGEEIPKGRSKDTRSIGKTRVDKHKEGEGAVHQRPIDTADNDGDDGSSGPEVHLRPESAHARQESTNHVGPQGDSGILVLRMSSGREVRVRKEKAFPMNACEDEVAEDLSKLKFLDEPNILHTLRCRLSPLPSNSSRLPINSLADNTPHPGTTSARSTPTRGRS
jgi:hypothetical protein